MAHKVKRSEVVTEWRGTIESVSQYGIGVGTIVLENDGRVLRRPIFIPYTAPGDEVEATILEQRGKYVFGELKALLKPSDNRAVPKCPHYGVCGGCNLLHVSYETQLLEKAKHLTFLFDRQRLPVPKELRVLPSRERHHYRARSRLAVSFKDGKVSAGFRKLKSKEIIPIKECLIVASEIVGLAKALNAHDANAVLNVPDCELEATIVVDERRKTRLLIPLDGIAARDREKVIAFFDALPSRDASIAAINFLADGKITPPPVDGASYSAAGFSFSFQPWTFIQSNLSTNPLLIETVLGFVTGDSVVDLYAGIGNLSLPIARKLTAGTVIAVEGDESSVLLGKENCQRAKVSNVTFVYSPVEEYLAQNPLAASTVVLDPPRTGCTPGVLDALVKAAVPRIVYVSCNPVTLADDLAKLKPRYELKELVGIDMFPDISHVEAVALLEKHER